MTYPKRRLVLSLLRMTALATGLSVLITAVSSIMNGKLPTYTSMMLTVLSPALITPVIAFYLENVRLQLEATQRKLAHLAQTDDLTGLYNRRYFIAHAEQQLKDRRTHPFSLLLIDIDHFKKVNDSWGHSVGDQALSHCATLIQEALRQSDVLARFGGEEFIVLLPQTPLEQAHTIAERIRRRVEEAPIHVGDETITLTLSIGCTRYAPPSDLSQLFSEADHALYQAKQHGRNRVEVGAQTSLARSDRHLN